MLRKYWISFLIICLTLLSGCSCSKEELQEENKFLEDEITKLEEESNKYKGIEEIFSFYNKITLESVNSFVLVESSKTLGETKYSDGVVVASNGYYYYILTDYNALYNSQGVGQTKYRVMDANASVYEAEVANVYDSISGLLLLRVNTIGSNTVNMKTITLGDKTDLLGGISSVNQINKVQLSSNIKTNTIVYSDVSYNVYSLEDIDLRSGALLNIKNQLCGIYLVQYNAFVDISLIKYIVYSTYSLVL